jgi:translocation and assembly module TamB
VKRLARRLLTLFAVLICTLLLTLGWLLATESGLQFLWRQITAQAGPELAATQVSGSLAGRLHIQELHYDTAAFALAVERLEIAWRPRGLLSGTLEFSEVSAAVVRYAQRPGTAETDTGPIELPDIALPLRLRLDALRVDTAVIVTSPDSEALQLQDIALAARASGARVELTRLSLAAPGLLLQGSAGMELRNAYPLQGTLDWQWQSDMLAPLTARTQIEGDLRRIELVQEILPPYSMTAKLSLIDVLDTLRLDGTLTLKDSSLAGIDSSWPALQINAALTLAGPLEQLHIKGSGNSVDALSNRVDATLEVELSTAQVDIQSMVLTLPEQATRLQLHGRVGFPAAATKLDLQADWQDFAWPLYAEPVATSASGRLALKGSLDAYRVTADALLDAPEVTPVQIQLQGQGSLDALEITAFTAALLDGSVQGSAQLAWSPQFAASLDLNGRELNPGLRWPDWPGNLGLQLQAGLEVSESAAWLLRFDNARVDGSLRGQALQMTARGSYRPGRLQIESGELTSGPTRVQLQGILGETLDLAWQLESPDLATLVPAAAGRISGKGSLQGTQQAPQLTAQLAGDDLRYQADRIGNLQLQAFVDAAGVQPSHLELVLSDARIAGAGVDKVRLAGSGYPQAHALTLAAAGSTGHAANLAIDGSWQQDTWTYRLKQADLSPAGLDTWHLRQAVTGRVSATQTNLPQACWSDAISNLCLQGALTATGREAAFRLQSLPLAALAGLLPDGIQLQGELQGDGRYQQSAEAAAMAHVRLTTSAGEIAATNETGEVKTLLAFAPGSMTLDLDAERARLELAMPLQANAGIIEGQASVSASREGWSKGRLTGEILASLPDIAFAGELLPDVSDLHGNLDGKIRLAGTLAAPRLQGKLLLANARALLDTPGVQLEDTRIEISGQPGGDILLDARTRSGDGELLIRGKAKLTGGQPEVALRIEGDNFRVLNTLEAEIDASPRLDVTLGGTRLDVNGKILVPRADIQPRKLPVTAVTASPDQVIIENGGPVEAATDYQVYATVRFSLGDAVRFDGLGLTGLLGGSVLAIDEPGQPTRASGELNIRDGKYKAYGQDLEIRRGRLLFAGGSLTEPGLDIEAVRQPAPDILVGVKVRGNLQKPVVRTFSEPDMPQSEQLSWLVLGRSMQGNTSDSEQSALNNAALMLGLSGGETLGKELGQTIGVDEIEVSSEAGDTTSASLLVGKYLTPKLLVSYGVGLFEPVSTLRLRYTLSSKWKLVGEASDLRSSADLFYVIETGD